MIDQSTLKSIEDLHRLKTDGVITEEEFERSKERLLFGGRPKVAAIGDIASTLRGETVPRPADDDHIGWTTLALRRFTDFEGRSSRKEFWMFQFIYVGLILVMFGGGLDAVAGTGFIGGLVFVLAVLSLLALTVPLIAVQVRRLHDLNRSGWLALINLVPYVGSIVIYVLMLVEGTPGDNRFGPGPAPALTINPIEGHTMTPSRYPLALACACLTLSACSSVRSDAEAAVRDSLKDPDSARFGEFYHNEQTGKACLTVNARNSMGGYTGDKQAFLIKTKDGWRAGGEAEAGPDICREMFADKADDAD